MSIFANVKPVSVAVELNKMPIATLTKHEPQARLISFIFVGDNS